MGEPGRERAARREGFDGVAAPGLGGVGVAGVHHPQVGEVVDTVEVGVHVLPASG